MAPIKSQNSNMLLAFLTLLGVIAIVAVVVESIILSEVTQSQRNSHDMYSLISGY